jgi:hypothetical protein
LNTVYINDNAGIKIIEARIIELTNQRIKLEKDIEEYKRMIKYSDKKHQETYFSRIKAKQTQIRAIEQVLLVNKNLLPFTDDHNYQLEN